MTPGELRILIKCGVQGKKKSSKTKYGSAKLKRKKVLFDGKHLK